MTTPATTAVVALKAPARRWRLDCRGNFALWDCDDRLVTLRGRKARAIMAFLAAHPDERVSRDRLIELLWADRGAAQARGSLRQSLLEIRRTAPKVISSDHDHVWIESAQLSSIEIADNCAPREQLFDDLDGVTPEFDDWLRCERAVETSETWSELQRSADDMLARGKGVAAISLIERMQRIDPYNEDWLRLAMRAEAQAGHPAGIQTRFRELDELLKRELGVSLSAQTRALHDELLADLSRPTPTAALVASSASEQIEAERPVHTATLKSHRWIAAAGLTALVTTLGLSQSAQTEASAPQRIAVLPFRALGDVDPALAEAMAEDVLMSLSLQRDLQVVGRTSSWMFKGRAEDLRRVGRKLDVQYIVEGSVREADGALRLNVTLVETRDASTLWSGRFASPSGDAQRIEHAVSGAILQRLGLHAVAAGRHAEPNAFAMYVRAKAIIRDRRWSEIEDARDLLEEAVRIDPNFAAAWAQLGGTINFVGSWGKTKGVASTLDWHAEALAAARRSIALDPNLAEGHQMLAFIHGFDTDEGRAHLLRALKLEPRNPQTVYWWSLAAEQSGDFVQGARAARYAMALDPFWKRPVDVSGKVAIGSGRRADAYAYLARLRAGNPEAAVDTEMAFATYEGDLSRVVQIGRDPRNKEIVASTDGVMTLASVLNELGYVRESLMVAYFSPFERTIYLRRLPGAGTILAEMQGIVDTKDEHPALRPLILELARTKRHADIVALYDRPQGLLSRLRYIKQSNRLNRAIFAGIVGHALQMSGRGNEARQLFRATDEAARYILKQPNVPPQLLTELGINQAILGRNEQALRLLERAVGRGWFVMEQTNIRLQELPWFETLHHDPRFQRLVRTTKARIARERRETEALGLV